jgi:hypothetical protein
MGPRTEPEFSSKLSEHANLDLSALSHGIISNAAEMSGDEKQS